MVLKQFNYFSAAYTAKAVYRLPRFSEGPLVILVMFKAHIFLNRQSSFLSVDYTRRISAQCTNSIALAKNSNLC